MHDHSGMNVSWEKIRGKISTENCNSEDFKQGFGFMEEKSGCVKNVANVFIVPRKITQFGLLKMHRYSQSKQSQKYFGAFIVI